jgi:imidazole glycerol-phosphate synthase subunit HisF
MLTRRIIACLDVTASRVVKGVQFLNLVDAGDPAQLAAGHAESGADEIVLLDISATHDGRGTLLDTVRRTAQRLFIPFTVGGGIRTLDDATAVFDAGADKVSINSAALRRPELIDEIGARFGALAPKSSSRAAVRLLVARLSTGRVKPSSAARARFFSRPWTPTVPATASIAI